MPEPRPSRKVEIIKGLLALQQGGELTVWIDALVEGGEEIIRVGPPAQRIEALSEVAEYAFDGFHRSHLLRQRVNWEQAARLVNSNAYRENFTRRWQ